MNELIFPKLYAERNRKIIWNKWNSGVNRIAYSKLWNYWLNWCMYGTNSFELFLCNWSIEFGWISILFKWERKQKKTFIAKFVSNFVKLNLFFYSTRHTNKATVRWNSNEKRWIVWTRVVQRQRCRWMVSIGFRRRWQLSRCNSMYFIGKLIEFIIYILFWRESVIPHKLMLRLTAETKKKEKKTEEELVQNCNENNMLNWYQSK